MTPRISDLSVPFLYFTYLFYINTKYYTMMTAKKHLNSFATTCLQTGRPFCRSERLQLQDMALTWIGSQEKYLCHGPHYNLHIYKSSLNFPRHW